MDFCLMVGGCVLDDGKSQSRTTGSFRVALVHPVEPFKDPILMLGRNTDAGIADNQPVILHLDRHTAAGNIVLDGVVAEIVDDLLEHSADTFHCKAITGHINLNILLISAGG